MLKDHNAVTLVRLEPLPLGLESSTLPLSHCAPLKNSEFDQEVTQSQTADKPMGPQGRAIQPLRDTRKTNQAKQPALSSPSR